MYHEKQEVCGENFKIIFNVEVFQLIEETAEMERMSRQKTLLIMERRNFLDNLANISYHDQLSQQVGRRFSSNGLSKKQIVLNPDSLKVSGSFILTRPS